MNQFTIPSFGINHLATREVPDPVPQTGQVLVEVKAVALNYRDLLVAKGLYDPRMPVPRVPCSDCAGVVEAVGEGVEGVKIGDRVCGTFFQDWDAGPMTGAVSKTALGGAIDGVLAEKVLLRSIVPIPAHLSYEEAATLPCAALTAWHALEGIRKGESVLVQGTGGVSMFALQFATAMGAKVYATSGDDAKLAKALALGATAGTNYKSQPDWDKWVRQQTGEGVDRIVEVGGAGTLDRSVKALKPGGTIALIGVLAGGSGFNPLPLMMKAGTLQGIYVGSRTQFLAMNEFIAKHKLKPIVDKVFAFDEAVEAFRYLEGASHFGKVVIRM